VLLGDAEVEGVFDGVGVAVSSAGGLSSRYPRMTVAATAATATRENDFF
jgi:hypothetical protein